jgi:hypothetical protein
MTAMFNEKLSISINKVITFNSLLILVMFLPLHISLAQELEPRQLSNIPVGTNYLLAGYAYAAGNILLDSSLPIEDLNADIHTIVGAYVRSIDFFGMSGKVDVIVPYAKGDWEGLLEGNDTSAARTGLGDPRFRLSFNVIGSPALKLSEYKNYNQETVVGVGLQVIAPLGQYDNTKLLNLGSNRWTFRPQIGISKTMDNWIVEAYLSSWFFTVNTSFYNGNELTQKPLFAGKLHVIYTLKNKMWLSFDFGYAIGGRSYLNDEIRDTKISTIRLGLDWSVPFADQHTLRLALISGIRLERGPDFDMLSVLYQFRWGG